MNKGVLLAIVAAGAVGTVFGAAELVRNGSFEETGDWGPDGKVFSFDQNGGQNGSGGIKWENSDPKEYRLLGQSLTLKTGMKYRYSCRVRQSGVVSSLPKSPGATPLAASICVAWNDKDGKWIAEVSASQKAIDCDWTELVGETPPMPANAKSFSVSLYVNRGCTGRVWFDDVSVVQRDVPPVSFLVSSAYRDLAADGEVEFRAVLKIDTEDTPLSGLVAEFGYEGVRGRKTVAASEFTSESAALRLPVAALREGKGDVRFSLKSGETGAELGTASLSFTRAKSLPARKAYVDDYRRLVVDGKPFFPIGMYLSNVDTNMVEAYAKGPWNCAMPYQGGKWADLDYLASKNLKVIYGLSDYWGKCGREPRYMTEEEAQADCRKTVLAVKDHPALIGWYVLDEMPLSFMPRMLARQKMMREIDPDHPTYAVLFQFYQIREYMPVCDVIGTDPYPIADCDISLPTDHARTVVSGTFGLKAMWQVPQAFDWGWFVTPEQYPGRCRLPTAEEARSMTWQSVAGGANGIVYWAYHYIFWRLKGEAYDKFYGAYCAVGEEVKRFIPVMLSVEPCASVLKEPANMSCRIWRWQERTYLLVCNTTREIANGEIVLSQRFSSVGSALDPAAPKLSGDRLSVSLKPMGVAMLRLED
ncbi:MAG: hypothetical protein IKE55_05880 [Kiritimatiellae bacterium]|nr:hypothetical protein [Kiritimatiellia bacterium]